MKFLLPMLLLVTLFAVAVPVEADTVCRMNFTMTGWSFFYRTAQGNGTISCENGQTANVHVWSKGGGVTFGRSKIKDATGRFTEVNDIDDVFGTYVQSEAHAGAGNSSKASASRRERSR